MPSKNDSAAPVLDTWRNRFAVHLCNVILNTVASRTYRDSLGEVILKGMKRNV